MKFIDEAKIEVFGGRGGNGAAGGEEGSAEPL